MRKLVAVLGGLVLVLTHSGLGSTRALAGPVDPSVAIGLEEVSTGVANPVAITHAGDGSGRLFITLQAGQIVIHDGVQLLPTPFLDIDPLVSCCGERGLFSVAFHPQYASNGHFYVNYTENSGATVIARYTVSTDPNLADPGSVFVLLTISQPFGNHNGGQLQFGPDGYLYIGTGDGGAGGDPDDRAQDAADLLGKLLRIDVNGALPYAIPTTNPFVGVPGAREEIWALGLRNPWRFGFDRVTGDLFTADVGQSSREEVDFQPASSPGGENYGWRRMEGSACFNPPADCDDGSLVLPILEYDHSLGCSITGGYRYRGSQYPQLYGTYFYGDFCSGRIWGATETAGAWTTEELLDSTLSISSFGEDQGGELYVAHRASSGTVYRIVALPACNDGLDNDGDGRIDFDPVTRADPLFQAGTGDPGCFSPLCCAGETPQCQDGINNDVDQDPNPGLIDFDGGQSIHGACSGGVCPPGVSDPNSDGVADPDPQCVGRPWWNLEKFRRRRCGLGYELAFLLPPLMWLHRRRRRMNA